VNLQVVYNKIGSDRFNALSRSCELFRSCWLFSGQQGLRRLRKRDEFVARPMGGENVTGGFRTKFQFLPQLGDVDVHSSRIRKPLLVTPYLFEKRVARNELIRVRNEVP